VHVAIPNYRFLPEVLPRLLDGVTIHRVGDHHHFQNLRDPRGIYETGGDFEPWVVFARAVVELVRNLDSPPDVVHCQDAHTCLVSVFIAAERQENSSAFTAVRTVVTIHNLLEQGRRSRQLFDRLSLPERLYGNYFEYYGDTNCFKAGLIMADRVSTVSHTYAHEIAANDEFGFGLAGVLRALPIPPTGIVNGIDGASWRLAEARYDGTDRVDAIRKEKSSLLSQLLPIWSYGQGQPVIAFKARWDRQKGILLLAKCMEGILEHARFIFDTWPEPREGSAEHFEAWRKLTALRYKYPLRLALNATRTTSPEESVALYTVTDFLVMPSVYEPCGLAQMECQRFGCIPIVRRTGGLSDTVTDLSMRSEGANGIVFDTMTRQGLMGAIRRAVEAYKDPEVMNSLIANTLRQKNEWHHRIEAYESLYESAIRNRVGANPLIQADA
jgi:starch synthase